jgi:hypothetical protein
MAIAQTSLTPSNWTLIGDNIDVITFQCSSTTPLYIGVTSTSSPPAVTDPGLIYNRFEGEIKRTLTGISYLSSPKYVWARALSAQSSVIYES